MNENLVDFNSVVGNKRGLNRRFESYEFLGNFKIKFKLIWNISRY